VFLRAMDQMDMSGRKVTAALASAWAERSTNCVCGTAEVPKSLGSGQGVASSSVTDMVSFRDISLPSAS
jgi:hypothetical protein